MKSSCRVSLPILTNSAEKTWRRCGRLYELEYVQFVRPLHDAEALAFGTLMHKALEAWWKAAKDQPDPKCIACDGTGHPYEVHGSSDACETCGGKGQNKFVWLRAALDALSADLDQFRRATLEALMMGYHSEWSPMVWGDAPIEVLAVEQQFSGPLVNPDTGKVSRTMRRGGKIDVLIRVAGDVWVVEHKTSASDFGPGSDYRRALRLDTQVSGYHVGARLLGYEDVKGVLYDVIGKPALRPLKATPPDKRRYTKAGTLYGTQREADESVDEYQSRLLDSIAGGGYYARFEVLRLAQQEHDAARDTWQRAEEIRDAQRLGRFPRNPSNCMMYNRPCWALPICEGTATANDGTRYRRAETPHEELNEEAA